MSAASFGFVSLLLLAAALPAASGLSASAVVSAPAAELPAQAFVNLSEASNGPVSRDAYGVTTRAELLRQQYTLTYTTTWSGPIRWPFPTPVRMVNRVHSDSTHLWPLTQPAISSRLTDFYIFTVGIRHCAHRRHTLTSNHPLFSRGKTEQGITSILANELRIGPACTS